MKTFYFLFLFLTLSNIVWACTDGVCVPKSDLQKFVQITKEAKCLAETKPKIVSNPLVVYLDKEGRIFASGSGEYPYSLTIDWCHYNIVALSDIRINAYQAKEASFGSNYRLKMHVGVLPLTVLKEDFYSGVDIGLMFEPFYYKFVNLNVYAGIRSSGIALGFDITKNFGLVAGIGLGYVQVNVQPLVGTSFSFW